MPDLVSIYEQITESKRQNVPFYVSYDGKKYVKFKDCKKVLDIVNYKELKAPTTKHPVIRVKLYNLTLAEMFKAQKYLCETFVVVGRHAAYGYDEVSFRVSHTHPNEDLDYYSLMIVFSNKTSLNLFTTWWQAQR